MKKQLRFSRCLYPLVGFGCILDLLDDHPNTSTRSVITSEVLRIEKDDVGKVTEIETLNTLYVAA